TMTDCLALYSHNNQRCDPNTHDVVCHYCCDTAECVRSLATGVYTPPSDNTTPGQQGPAASTMESGATSAAVVTNLPSTTGAAVTNLPSTAAATSPVTTTSTPLPITTTAAAGEKCFSYHCPHHATLRDCLQGTWQCDAGEYCEIQTRLNHGNAAWVTMDCHPTHSISHCLTTHSHNDPGCDPNAHDKVCSWCCEDEVCVRTLASGVYVVPEGQTTPPPPATTSPPPTTAEPLWTTTSTPAPSACSDLYLGDCTVDFAGRCNEPLVQQLCMLTCNVPCPIRK
ncbi:hypothetical protein BaRGS_00018938, partial [Batillaria attramentaria]